MNFDEYYLRFFIHNEFHEISNQFNDNVFRNSQRYYKNKNESNKFQILLMHMARLLFVEH